VASPFFSAYDVINTPNGAWIKPGGQVVAYVRSTGVQSGDLPEVANNMVATVNQGVARCRSGMNDIVYVLPGHVETVSTADFWSNLVAGAQIVSAGSPGATNNPTFTFTATASQLLIDVANVSIVGMNFLWNGIDNIVLPVSVTAAGFTFAKNNVVYQTAAGVAQPVDGIALGAGSHGARVNCNTFLSQDATDQNTGSVILVGTGAAQALQDIQVCGNYIIAATPGDTDGIIHVASTGNGIVITDNIVHQLATTADSAIRVDAVVAMGAIGRNYLRLTENLDPALSTTGVVVGAGALMAVFENRCSSSNAPGATQTVDT
jgi:hypothetical protein